MTPPVPKWKQRQEGDPGSDADDDLPADEVPGEQLVQLSCVRGVTVPRAAAAAAGRPLQPVLLCRLHVAAADAAC